MKTKTRLITILLILSCVFICAISITLIFAASQQNMQTDFDVEYTSPFTFTLNSDNESYSVSALSTSVSGNLTIPSTYNGKPVTAIANNGFYNCAGLTNVTIPSGVTSIGDSAFIGCTSLTEITIPSTVTSIGVNAFMNCTSLTSITIPSGVTSIGRWAFNGCAITNAEFGSPSGWFVTTDSSATSGTDLGSTALGNKTTAATYLRSTYYNYYWKRSGRTPSF